MATPCTRCEGTGFLNLEQIGDLDMVDTSDHAAVLAWIGENDDRDVQVCDCCGNGHNWHGTPDEHYGPDDPRGPRGPYAYNGGLCECH